MKKDPLYEKAKTLVIDSQRCSASFLQRRLGFLCEEYIGYARVARMIDQMEKDGIVGWFDSGRERKVLTKSKAK